MRLTLRTLLAYMDDVLEPEDREDLKAKIEHSEFAGDLLHRARDVMRRIRLGAPAVGDLKKSSDANSVAEYLDNTMPPEQVADFERLCLESDVELAEVASCHQILTMVLGEPADVRPDARSRMYEIPAMAEMAIPAADATDGEPAAALPREEMPQIEIRSAHASHVPDYLRESVWERHGRKLMLAAAILVVGLAYLFWPPGEPDLPRELAHQPIENELNVPDVDEGLGEVDGGAATDPTADVTTPLNQDDLTAPPPFVPDPLDDANAAEPSGPADVDDDDLPDLPPEVAASELDPQIRLPSEAIVEDLTTGVASPAPPLPAPVPTERVEVTGTDTTATPIPPPLPAEANATDVAEPDSGDTTETTAEVEPPAATGPEHVATYVSSGEVLLRRDAEDETNAWFRLSRLDKLYEGDQLLALPGSRPIITLLGSNLSIQLQPATRVVLAINNTSGWPNLGGVASPAGLTVQYGRLVLFNPAPSGTWGGLRLQLGGAPYGVELEGESTFAVDARRKLPAGVNPLEITGDFLADLFVTTGRVRWQEGDASRTIEAPAHWHVVNGMAGGVEPLAAEPSWISGDTVSDLDKLALPEVEPALVPGRSVRLSLAELAEHRRREVKGLVSRASIHIGNFDPFVKSLNDASQKAAWDENIAVLRAAMALDPQVAARVREAFVKYKGEQAGEELFRLLWGYSKAQLEGGALEELINYLNHESLDVRVLAFNNLVRATGKQLLYSPDAQPQQREMPIREWRKRLLEANGLEVRPEGTG